MYHIADARKRMLCSLNDRFIALNANLLLRRFLMTHNSTPTEMGFNVSRVGRHQIDQMGIAGALTTVVSHATSIAKIGEGVKPRL